MYQRKLIAILSGPAASLLAITVAIAARILLQIHFLNFDNDRSYQILAAKNFAEGNGFTLLQAFPDDLSKYAYVPLTMWPQGYSLFLSPLILLFKNNLVLASICLDALTCILFVIYSRKLFTLFSPPLWLLNLYALLTGFFIYKFSSASSTDFLTLSIFLAALFYCIKLINKETLSVRCIVLVLFLLFFCGLTRYQYIPITFIVPGTSLLIGWIEKNRFIRKTGFILLTGLTTLFTVYLLTQFNLSGTIVFVPDGENSFSPGVILELYPFLLAAFINTDFLYSQLHNSTGVPYSAIATVFSILHLVILLLLTWLAVAVLAKMKNIKKASTNRYLFMGLIVSVLSCFLLISISIGYAPYSGGQKGLWTYVIEGRYYGFVIVFVQQVFLWLSYKYRNRFKKIIISLALILLINFLHDVYYLIKLPFVNNTFLKYPDSMAAINKTNEWVKKIKTKYPETRLVVIAQPAYLASHAGFYSSTPAFYTFKPLKNQHFFTTGEILCLVILDSPDNMPALPGNNPPQLLEKNKNLYYYLVNVQP